MTTSTSGKRKQKKGSAPTGDSQPAAGGELHQIAAGEHPALTAPWTFQDDVAESLEA